MTTQEITFPIRGISSARCTEQVQSALDRVDGVVSAAVNYATERARVLYNPSRTSAAGLLAAVRAAGYDVPVERVVVGWRDLRAWWSMRAIVIDLQVGWRSRTVVVYRLAGSFCEGSSTHVDYGQFLFLLAGLFRSELRRRPLSRAIAAVRTLI